MSRNTPAIPEAERYVSVEFNFQTTRTGTISIHKADCGTEILISGLKLDFGSIFGDPDGQEWFHRTTKLVDTKTLSKYGLNGRDRHTIKIYVRQTKPVVLPDS